MNAVLEGSEDFSEPTGKSESQYYHILFYLLHLHIPHSGHFNDWKDNSERRGKRYSNKHPSTAPTRWDASCPSLTSSKTASSTGNLGTLRRVLRNTPFSNHDHSCQYAEVFNYYALTCTLFRLVLVTWKTISQSSLPLQLNPINFHTVLSL